MTRGLFAVLLVAALGAAAAYLLGVFDGDGRTRYDRENRPEVDDNSEEDPEPVSRGGNDDRPRRDGAAPPVAAQHTVRGRVRDVRGDAIPEALVQLIEGSKIFRRSKEVLTDAEGRFELRTAGRSVQVQIRARGFLPLVPGDRAATWYLEGKGPWEREFVLTPAAFLGGTVRDETGAPVAGAKVYVISPEHLLLDTPHGGNTAKTREDGTYLFPGLREGTYDLGVRGEGFLPELVRGVVMPGQGQVQRDLTLKRGRSVRVIVTGPPKAIRVRASDSGLRSRVLPPGGLQILENALVGHALVRFPVVAATVKPDEATRQASVVLSGLPSGPVDLLAYRVGSAGLLQNDVHFVEVGLNQVLDSTEPEVHLHMVPLAFVNLEVTDAATGQPLQPRVRRRTDGTIHDVQGLSRLQTLFIPADERSHTLLLDMRGYEPAEVPLAPLGEGKTRTVQVRMHPTAQGETGTFRLILDRDFTGRMAVIGRDADGRVLWQKHPEMDDKGRWPVKAVPVGTYRVTVLMTGMVPVQLPRVVVAKGLVDEHRIALSEGGGLKLAVKNEEGELLDKVHILLQDAREQTIDVQIFTQVSGGRAFVSVNYLPTATTVSADSGLPPGEYTLNVGREGYLPERKSFSIAARETAELEFQLRKR